jgi:hypothetical protein
METSLGENERAGRSEKPAGHHAGHMALNEKTSLQREDLHDSRQHTAIAVNRIPAATQGNRISK